MKNSDCFVHEDDYGVLDAGGAVGRLRQALRFDTTSHVDTSKTDYTRFDALHAFIRRSFPHVMCAGTYEEIGHSLLITIPGTDASLSPALFLAHQDVVPAEPSVWAHHPFSGDLEDGYIWGRGAMDIKQLLMGELESAEFLLSQGLKPRRSIMFAFGEDEETCSVGARVIADELQNRSLRFEYVLDEGLGGTCDASDWGAPGRTLCPIGLYEKGYGDLQITARSAGGHSSNPFNGTSLGILADAIHNIIHGLPPARLQDSVIAALKELRPYMTDGQLKNWAADPKAHETELLSYFLSRESLAHLVRTTAAPTMIEGGAPAANVLPQDMRAVINLRLIPGDGPDELLERFRKLAGDKADVSWLQQISASNPSGLGSWGFGEYKKALGYYFDRLIFIPQQNRAYSDCRWYEPLTGCAMRFAPFLEEEDIAAAGVHGVNERISVRAYLQGIRVLTRFMEKTCF